MARTRITDAPLLKSWEDVDRTLREIALAQIALDEIEGDMNKQITGIKEIAAREAQPIQERIEKLGADIKAYVDEHQEELGKKKTKALNFGETGYRQSTTITVPKDKAKLEEIIRRLKARKMSDCLITKVTINKDSLRQYGNERVLEVGANYKQKDVFWFEAAKTKLEALAAPEV